MLTTEQTELVRGMVADMFQPAMFEALARAINEACRDNEAKWREHHDKHAPEPLPQTDPVDVKPEQLANVARECFNDEARAIGIGASVATKEIAPYAVPFHDQNAFEKKRKLIILNQLFLLPAFDAFREFYQHNIRVDTKLGEDGVAVVHVSPRDPDAVHCPELPKKQRAAFLQALHRIGVGKAAYHFERLWRIVQPGKWKQEPMPEEPLVSVPTRAEAELAP